MAEVVQQLIGEELQNQLNQEGVSAVYRIPELVLYQHYDFGGWEFRTNLNFLALGSMRNSASSIVVVSGIWQFYTDENHLLPIGNPVGPGYYRKVDSIGIQNNEISSFKCVGLTER